MPSYPSIPQIVVFAGKNGDGNTTLWTTDGTAGGTQELAVQGAANNFAPANFTVGAGELLFSGNDASGYNVLWVTDGTAAGTQALAVTGANATSFNPSGFLAYKGDVLFAGTDVDGRHDLWRSDGTAAGTQALAVQGAEPSYGLSPADLTAYNGNVLFSGTDGGGGSLWISNGTAAGTYEITGVSGINETGLDPTDLTAYQNKVLFNGLASDTTSDLWVTDGTAAGTQEITGVTGAGPNGLNPTNMIVYNNKVLFEGTDASGNQNLWVTDGTAAGTQELTGIAGASADGLRPQSFYDSSGIVFNGYDASGNQGLWTTDGTAAGTQEISGIAGANESGVNPSDFATTVDHILFAGTSTEGTRDLWRTDESAESTIPITGILGANPDSGLGPTNLTVFPPPPPTAVTVAAQADAMGPLSVGHVITFTLTPSAAVTVTGGTPTLTLNDGGIATYDAANSTPTSLVFTTTVATGQDTSDLLVTGLALGDGTIIDDNGSALDASGLAELAGSDTGLVIHAASATPAAPPASLALAVASDSGVHGDNRTKITTPVITGTGVAGDTVTLHEGETVLGTGIVQQDGTWSIATSVLSQGAHILTATEVAEGGGASVASAGLTLTIDTTAPVVTAAAVANPAQGLVHGYLLNGTGDPNALVTITEGGHAVGTAQAGADGTWSFDPSGLTPGAHSFIASETDAAGNTGAASAVSVNVPDPRFILTNQNHATSGTFVGSDYSGPISYLQAQYGYTGTDNVVLVTTAPNVFLHTGSGEDALAAVAGSNVLDGGTNSSWMVGAPGTDGGHDIFYADARGGHDTWNTLVNFHPGDTLTLWGYNPASGSLAWADGLGTAGYQGATLEVALGDGSGAGSNVTFAGLTTSGAVFSTSTGTSGGASYLAVTRTA